MHDPVQHRPIPSFRLAGAENAAPERGAVDFSGGVGAEAERGGWGEGLQEVGGGGTEFAEDLRVGVGAWEEGFAGEEVGVYDGEVVGRGVEKGGDGGFARGEGAG